MSEPQSRSGFSQREMVLVGLVVLLLGLIGGFFLAGGNDGESAETSDAADQSDAATTTVASTTVAPTTLAPTTLAPKTLAPTTLAPTTLAPPDLFVAEVANAVSGEVMGMPIGAWFDEVEFLMVETFGAPDSDTDWIEGCPLDGPALNERSMTWDGLQLNFKNDTGTAVLTGWTWNTSQPVPTGTFALDPQPDDWKIALHPDVTADMSLTEIGNATGTAAMVTDFGFGVVTNDWSWVYFSPGPDLSQPPLTVDYNLVICD